MDCEKFDSHVIDALYDELDEVTTAALKRHVEGCSRCAGVWSGLRATREVGLLPIEDPSDDLEDRILTAAARIEVRTPWSRRVLRGLAWAGSHAMRPQLAMAALFFLVIGSSLLLLRARPGSHAGMPVRVTERGAPAPEAEAPEARRERDQRSDEGRLEVAAAATAAPQAAPTSATLAAPGAQDPNGTAAKPAEKESSVASAADADGVGNQDLARKALATARATRDQSGCSAALSGFDQVGSKFPGTSAAADAMMDAASCYKSMGDVAKARELLLTLRGSDGYRDRANNELNDLSAGQANSNNLGNAQGVAAAVPRAAAPAAAPPPAPAPAAKAKAGANEDAESTSGKKAVAAPAKKAPGPQQADRKAAEGL